MNRFWVASSHLLLLGAAFAVAAPAPRPATRRVEQVFGRVVETRGVKCEMTLGRELRVRVSKEAATARGAHAVARPLVTKKAEGDFEVTVRVTHAPPDARELDVVGTGCLTASAGLALYPPGKPKESITFLQQHIKEGATWKTDYYTHTQYNEVVYESNRRPGRALDDRPVYLRITRRGNEFTSAWSHDGKRWTAAALQGRFGIGTAVLIGPVAAHNTTGRGGATFGEYTLTSPPEEKE